MAAAQTRPRLASPQAAQLCAGALSTACAAHARLAAAAKAGCGVDRHLLGLLLLAKEAAAAAGRPLPALFTDPAFAASRRWRLSTSNCGSQRVQLFGFGPVVEDGFGLAYMIHPDAVTVNITAWAHAGNSPRTDPGAFVQALEESLKGEGPLGLQSESILLPRNVFITSKHLSF